MAQSCQFAENGAGGSGIWASARAFCVFASAGRTARSDRFVCQTLGIDLTNPVGRPHGSRARRGGGKKDFGVIQCIYIAKCRKLG